LEPFEVRTFVIHVVSHRVRTTSLAGILAGLLLCFCGACQTAGTRADPPASAAAADPVVRVTGDRGDRDLGRVAPGSTHTVIFEIVNPSDRPLKLLRVQSGCDCTTVRASPAVIPAQGADRVEAVFAVPDVKVKAPYETELLVLTDAPDRKLIHLGIRCVGK
jgi:hypothetical protein